MRDLLRSDGPWAAILVRIAVGVVFLTEGVLKFLHPEALGAGRFAKIGIPAPEVMGPFVAVVETACGALVLAGLGTRLAAVPLVIDMGVAIASTKVPILLGHGYLGFAAPSVATPGLLAMLHEARTDLAMLFGSLFLAITGAGPWSLDRLLARARRSPPERR